jgi:hypothetical protein
MLYSPLDDFLSEIASVVDKEVQARNAELSENRRMQFRI